MLTVRAPLLQPLDWLQQAGAQAGLRDTLLSTSPSGADLTPSSMWLLALASRESHVLLLWPGHHGDHLQACLVSSTFPEVACDTLSPARRFLIACCKRLGSVCTGVQSEDGWAGGWVCRTVQSLLGQHWSAAEGVEPCWVLPRLSGGCLGPRQAQNQTWQFNVDGVHLERRCQE